MSLCFGPKLKCIEDVKVELNHCLPNCQGSLITSYEKKEKSPKVEAFLATYNSDYDRYKRKLSYPASVKGMASAEVFIPIVLS